MAATKESGKNLGLGSRERRSGRWVQNPGSETLISDHKTVRRTTTLAKTTASILPSQQEAHSWWCCSSLLQGDRCRLQRAWKLPSSSSKECSPAKRISILEKTRSRLTGPQLQHSYGSGYGTRCLFDPESGIEDGTKKVCIRIRDEQSGPHFLELRNHFLFNTWSLWCGSGIRDGKIQIWDGKKLDPRFLINIPDPQHCFEGKKDQYFIFLIRNSISIQKFVKESPDPAKWY